MKPLIIITVAAVVLVIIAALFSVLPVVVPRPDDDSTAGYESQTDSSAASRLSRYIRQQRPYRFYVTTNEGDPRTWLNAVPVDEMTLALEGGDHISVYQVRSFLIGYASGEILDSEAPFLPLPDGLHYIEEAEEPTLHFLESSEFRDGSQHVELIFGEHPENAEYSCRYATWFTNTSAHKLRVLKFGGYVPEGRKYRLHTISGTFFTAEQFRNWYGMDSDWIMPGQTVCDPNNYGGAGFLWAYWCETSEGERFIVAQLDK